VDHTRLLQTSLSRYFNKPLFSDITVIGPDGRKLLCHQVVLSAGSKRFANMLEQGTLPVQQLVHAHGCRAKHPTQLDLQHPSSSICVV
jgi:hypothetical protein